MADTRTHLVSDSSGAVAEAALLLERVVRNVVADLEAVKVRTETKESVVYFTLGLAPDDLEKLLLNPRSSEALQSFVSALGKRSRQQYLLHL